MPLFKEENFLIIHVGSFHTLYSFGLQDTLTPPQHKIESKVYKNKKTNEYKTIKNDDEDLVEIYPVKCGKIIDMDGFCHLLQTVFHKITVENPIVTTNQIPFLLVLNMLLLSRSQIESITNYVIQKQNFTAFNIIDLSLAASFGYGTSKCSIVVNIGHEYVLIVPIIQYQIIKFALKYLPFVGGISIDEELKKSFPDFSNQQIFDLKTSGIMEIIHDNDHSELIMSDFDKNDEADFAVLVGDESFNLKTNDDDLVENKKLAKNFFYDSITKEKICVNKERFQKAESFIKLLSKKIFKSLLMIPDHESRQKCYNNLIITGSTIKIPGLKKALLYHLNTDHLVNSPLSKLNSEELNQFDLNPMSYHQNEDQNENEVSSISHQVPISIKYPKYPDYFIDWKKKKQNTYFWNDIYFLGGIIYGKQIFFCNFNHGRDLFIDNENFEDKGPQCIWDVIV